MENDFNNKYCERTKFFTIQLVKALNLEYTKEATRVIIRQILRSGTSISANFRAASRARSKAEYYSKICIVVEECDETLFWLEILLEAALFPKDKLLPLQKESSELLKIFSSTRKTLKQNK
jgi:four helix bundle protein